MAGFGRLLPWVAVTAAICGAVALSPLFAQAASTTSLQGEWHLDSVGATTPDSSGNGLDLTTTNIGAIAGGRFSGAAGMSANGVMRRTAATQLESANVTTTAWVHALPNGNGGWVQPGNLKYVMADSTHLCNGSSYALYTGSGGGMQFYVYEGGTAQGSPVAAPAGLWDGNWHAIAGTYDGSTVRLYVDGAQVGSGTAAPGAIDYAGANSHDFTLGNYPDLNCAGGIYGFKGYIDESHVYNRALTPSEVATLASPTATTPPEIEPTGPTGPTGPPPATPPTAHFNFVTGQTVKVLNATVPSGLSSWVGGLSSTAGSGGRIIKYIWDTNGDGKAEFSCPGDAPAAEINFPHSGVFNVILTTEDESGATSSVSHSMAIKLLGAKRAKSSPRRNTPPPGYTKKLIKKLAYCIEQENTQQPDTKDCIRSFIWSVVDVNARSKNCFKLVDTRRSQDTKSGRNSAGGRFTQGFPYPVFRATVAGPVAIDGIEIPIESGHTSSYDTGTGRVSIHTGNPLHFEVGDDVYSIGKPDLDFIVPPGNRYHVTGINLDKDFNIGDLKVGGGAKLDLVEPGRAELKVGVELPNALSLLPRSGGGTVEAKVAVSGSNIDDFSVDNLHAGFPDAWFGPLQVNQFSLDYAGGKSHVWTGGAEFVLGPNPDDMRLDVRPGGKSVDPNTLTGVQFTNGKLTRAGGRFFFGEATAPMIGPGVFLSELGFGFAAHPTRVCGEATLNAAKIYDVTGHLLAGFPEYGESFSVPSGDDALCSFPLLAGRTFDTTTVLGGGDVKLRVYGDIKLPLGSAYLLYSDPGRIEFAGEVDVPLGIFRAYGRAGGFIDAGSRRFSANLEGHFDVQGLGGGLELDAVASSLGLGACAGFEGDVWGYHVNLKDGFTYRWGPIDPVSVWNNTSFYLFGGCDTSPFVIAIPPGRRTGYSRAGTESTAVTLKKGSPADLKINGVGGAPDVTIRGPKGETFSTAGGTGSNDGTTFRYLRNTDFPGTFIGIGNPSAGTWTISTNPGSVPIESVELATALTTPKVKVKVTGKGGHRTLRYDITKQPGLTVTFAEKGDGVYTELGTVKAGKGKLKFKPTTLVGGKRQVIAVEKRGGVAVRQLKVSKFTVPKPRLTKPKGVHAKLAGGKLRLSWKGQPAAASYETILQTKDGLSRTSIGAKPKAAFKGVSAADRPVAKIYAIGLQANIGPAATVKVKQHH